MSGGVAHLRCVEEEGTVWSSDHNPTNMSASSRNRTSGQSRVKKRSAEYIDSHSEDDEEEEEDDEDEDFVPGTRAYLLHACMGGWLC